MYSSDNGWQIASNRNSSQGVYFRKVQNGTWSSWNKFIDSQDIYVDVSNGNIGIGSNSPTEKLQVDGNIKAAGDFIGSALKLGFAGTANITTNDTNEDLFINPNGVGDILMQTSGGNVGIGTTSPSAQLHSNVSGGSINYGMFTIDTNAWLNLFTGTGIAPGAGSAGQGALYWKSGGVFRLGTSTSTAGAGFVDSVRIDENGNVGIGTTSPAEKLDVAGNIKIANNGKLYSDQSLSIDIDGSSSGSSRFFSVTHNNSASELFRVQENGNVGIGTTSPSAKLEVAGSGNQKLLVNRTDGDNFSIDAQNGQIRLRGSSNIIMGVGADVLTVTNSKVGIGTTSPGANLHISGTTSTIRLEDTDGTNTYGRFRYSGSSQYFYSRSNTANGNFIWVGEDGTTSTEFMRINGSNGRVGIGLTNPSQLLHVAGNIRVTGAYYDSNNSPGTSGQILSATLTGTDWIDNAHIPSPAPTTPGSIVSTIVGQTIEIEFDESTTSNIDYYQVWSSDDGGGYGIIAQIPPTDFSATMTVVDTSFSTGGTMSYRVYAVKSGVYSSPGTTSKTYTVGSLDVTDMTVINLNTAYHIQYEKPASRFIDHIEIYMDSQTTQGALNRSNASIIYSGQNTSFMKSVGVSNNFHQFWVEVVTT